MSEHDLRVLSEIEHSLELLDLGRHRHLSGRGLLLASSGVFVGAALIAIGLWVTAAMGTVAAVCGFVLIVWASQHAAIRTQRAWLANPGGRGTRSRTPAANR